MKGSKELVSVNLSPEVVDPDDIEMLEDLIVAALNDGYSKADEVKAFLGAGMYSFYPGCIIYYHSLS